MDATFIALVIVVFSQACAFVLCRLFLFKEDFLPYFVIWVLVTATIFLIHIPILVFSILAVILFFYSRSNLSNTVPMYLAIISSVPAALQAPIPFPQLEQLFTLDFARLCTIVFLFGAFLSNALGSQRPTRPKVIDYSVWLLFLLFSALSFRSTTLTDGLREMFYLIILLVVPYFAMSRSLSNLSQFHNALKAVLVSLVILSSIGLASIYYQWNFFASSAAGITGNLMSLESFRSNNLRVGLTLNPVLLGFLLAVGILILEYGRHIWRIGLLPCRLMQTLFAIVIFFTSSRGGWLAGAAAVLLYVGLKSRISAVRLVILGGIIFAPLFVVSTLLVGDGPGMEDTYGTFQYRESLIRNSLPVIYDNFWLGSPDYLSHPSMEASRQSRGMIDVVNAYLQIALEFGVPTVLLYFSIFGIAIFYLLSKSNGLRGGDKEDLRNACNLMAAILVGYVLLIGTVSHVSLIPHYGYIFAGMAVAVIRFSVSETQGARLPASRAPGYVVRNSPANLMLPRKGS